MSAYAARARHILRTSDGVKRHLDAMTLVRDLARADNLDTRRRSEMLATIDRAEAELAALTVTAAERKDADTIATLMRLGTELAVLSRMVEHVPLSVVRGDGGAASRGSR